MVKYQKQVTESRELQVKLRFGLTNDKLPLRTF